MFRLSLPKRLSVIGLCIVATLVPALLPLSAEACDYCYDSYAAIAYSQSTGEYGYSYNCSSRWEAEALALANCDASDAFIAVWVCNGFCALALGDDVGVYGWGWDTWSSYDAQYRALVECSESTNNTYVAVVVYSG